MKIDNISSVGATSLSVFEIREQPDGFVSKSSELEEITEQNVKPIQNAQYFYDGEGTVMVLFYLPEFSLSGEKTVNIHMGIENALCERLTDSEILDCVN